MERGFVGTAGEKMNATRKPGEHVLFNTDFLDCWPAIYVPPLAVTYLFRANNYPSPQAFNLGSRVIVFRL